MTLVKLCHLGKKVMTPNVKQYLDLHAAYVRPRRAAAHGTVRGACFNDVCMRFMGLAMFLFINFNHFLLQ